jgi:molybdopterin-guanine dinucleotide biosynthesis protein A
MGRPKAWLPFGDQTVIERVVAQVGEAVSAVIVVGAQGQELPALPTAVKIVHDDVPDQGPLGGLAAGLAATSCGCEAVYLSSCDAPFVNPALVRRLFELLGNKTCCVPRVGGRLHPLSAVYRVGVLDKVREHLRKSRLRMLELVEDLPARIVATGAFADVDPDLKAFWNLNTKENYEQALREAGLGS